MKTGGKQSDATHMAFGMSRLTAGAKAAWNAWFGPNTPITPILNPHAAEDAGARGRQFDYRTGVNLTYQPRQEENTRPSFAALRGLADSYDLLRGVIETCKDEIESLEWMIRPKDQKKHPDDDPRCAAIAEFLMFPDKDHTWKQWVRALLEDLYVIDAATIYPRMTRGGDLYSLDIVDGATIKRVIDERGRTPVPPDAAYQQILKGVPASEFTREELVYHPRNYRSAHIYGMSPVEQVMMTVNIAIRRQLHQLQFYTEGTVPDAFIGVPESWNPDQIRMFQDYWDSLLENNTAQRRHARFIPAGTHVTMTKTDALKDDYDEWLARIVCFFFSQSPAPFVKQMNRATSESSAEQAKEQGSKATARWLEDLITNRIIHQFFNAPDLEFAYKIEDDTDALVQAQIDQIYLQEYVVSPNEIRQRKGMEGPAPTRALLPSQGEPAATGGADDGGVVGQGEASPGAVEKSSSDDDVERASKKKTIEPIDRDRASQRAISEDFRATLIDFFDVAADDISTQISVATKAGCDVDQIIEGLDFGGWSALIEPTVDYLKASFLDGIDAGFAQIGVSPTDDMSSLVNQAAVEYADRRGAQYVGMWNVGTKAEPTWIVNPRDQEDGTPWAITDTTRDMVRGQVTTAMDEGWSNDRLASSLKGSCAFNDSRAEMVARTETAFADSYGNKAAYQASGVVTGKEWLVGSEHDDDDECDANADAGVIGLDELFPDGSDMPPAHPRCVCCAVPRVVDTEESE